MTWLNKILRSETPDRPAAAAEHARPQSKVVVADPQQIRLRLSQAVNATNATNATNPDEAERLTQALGEALAQTRQAPLPEDSAWVRSHAIMLLSDKPSALSWLAELNEEECLAAVALQARLAEVRLSAARRLDSGVWLERVAQASRDKDKGVYRHCATVLQQRQMDSASAARAVVLEAELETLLAEDPVAATRLVDLEREFQQLAGNESPRCKELMTQFRTRAQEQARHMQMLHARHMAVAALAADMEQPAGLSAEHLVQLRQRWCELTENPAAAPEWLVKHKEALTLKQLLVQIEARLTSAEEDLQRLNGCADFLANHEQGQLLGEADIAAWEALAKPENQQLWRPLQARWEACLKRQAKPVAAVAEPVAPVQTRLVRDPAASAQLIDRLSEAIEQGHLADASKLDADIAKLESAAGLPHGQAQRLLRVRADLLKLRGWARWGSDQARQQLIVQAEQLSQGHDDVAALAQAIAKLRQEWKGLDSHAASNKALWQRFDTLVEKAYAPVAAHRAELAAKLQVARQAREALCLKWEEWQAQVAWEHADMRVVQTMRQEICDAWRALGAPGARERRGLQKRFEKLLAGLDTHIETARRAEIERCEALIVAAQALTQESRLRQAIEGIKKLQQRWREEAGNIRLGRAEQEKLWKRFRAACDAVFARREEEKVQQTAQRAQQRETAQLKLAELQGALNNQDEAQVRQRIADFRGAWRAASTGNMPASANQALQSAEAHLESLQVSKREAPLRLLMQKTALIEQVESEAAGGASAEAIAELMRTVQSQWQALPRSPAKFEQPLTRRLAAASRATASGLAEGCKLRTSLLLDLELALGLSADAASEVSRRNRHLQLLQQKFQRGQSPSDDLDRLVADWLATAAVSDAQQQQRMTLILQAMRSKSKTGVL